MSQFKFSVGPWNVHEGADTFGPEVRKPIAFEKKWQNSRKSDLTRYSSMTLMQCLKLMI